MFMMAMIAQCSNSNLPRQILICCVSLVRFTSRSTQNYAVWVDFNREGILRLGEVIIVDNTEKDSLHNDMRGGL